MWKSVVAFCGLGILFFLLGLMMTFVAPPWDPFAHRNRILYSLAWGITMPTVALIAHWVSLRKNAWIYAAFVLITGSGIFYFLLASSQPDDPWAYRLGLSIGIIALFIFLGWIADRIEKREKRARLRR